MENFFIQMYKSFKKIDPYDWFCGPGSHLLKGEEPPSCLTCQTKITVKHILLDCTVFNVNRQWFYSEVFNLFKNVSPEFILESSSVDLKCLL